MEKEDIIGSHIVDNLSASDKENKDPVLEQWLAEDEAHKQDLATYRKIWDESSHYISPETFDAATAWHQVDQKNKQRTLKARIFMQSLYVTTGIAAATLVFIFLFQGNYLNKPVNTNMSIAAAYGSNANAVLPDGSHVNLNAGTNLVYTYNSKLKIREVRFNGEAFFHVAKSKEPFVIKLANGLVVRDWGTSFNLQAYDNEDNIEASLVEGKIELLHDTCRVMMKPGDIAVFDKVKQSISVKEGIPSHAYGWLNNKFYMDNMPLTQICRYLERRYDVRINIPTSMAESIHYTGVLKEETITDILDALSQLSDIQYSIKGKNISITSKSGLPMK